MKILIVDDDPLVARLLSLQLARLGHDCRVEGRADRIAEHVLSWRPDRLLLDVMLPGFNAADALSEWRRRDDNPPVVLLSSLGELARRKLPEWTACLPLLRKPVAAATLASALADAGAPGVMQH